MSDNSRPLPIVFGCAGLTLSSAERAFFKNANPFGIILFKRNCSTVEQLRTLIKELRLVTGRPDLPFLIDQEGGRVSRLQPPVWMKYPEARLFGQMYESDPEWGAEAVQCFARLVAFDLRQVGITINCSPVVDLYIEGATPAIGDRAYSRRPEVVAALARIYAETLMNHGILPVIKHFPGHGRMKTDPHLMLPVVETSRAELETDDFMAFELLKDLPIGMNSHAVFTNLDAETPVSLSATIHNDIIRGSMGFDGLMLSDDITMKALHGLPGELARRVLEAGADVALHCSGDIKEMEAITAALSPMAEAGWERWGHALSMANRVDTPYNPREDTAKLDILLGGIAFEAKTRS